MVTLISATVCWRLIDRASARGAAAKTSSETSWVLSAVPPPLAQPLAPATATPAWATSITQERWSAGSSRNQGSVSSIRATLAVASAPAARSIRRSVADSSPPPGVLTALA